MHTSNRLARRLRAAVRRIGGIVAVASCAALAGAFEQQAIAIWPAGEVAFHLQLSGVPARPLIDGSADWNAPFEAALAEWNKHIAPTVFRAVRDSTALISRFNRQSNVFFSDTVYGEAWGGRTIGVCLYVTDGTNRIEADIIFNRKVAWDSYRGPQAGRTATDLRRLAMHELGHAIGLEHPFAGDPKDAIMVGTVDDTDTLTADDIAGATLLYGKSPPVIVKQPTAIWNFETDSRAAREGEQRTFDVKVAGRPPFTFQWFEDGREVFKIVDPLNSDSSPQSVESSHRVRPPATVYVKISNANGTTTSEVRTLALIPSTAPRITTQPTRYQQVTQGATVDLSVVVSGANLSYQWKRFNTSIPGATTAMLRLTQITSAQSGTYTVTVTNGDGTETSFPAQIDVGPGSPIISEPPKSQSVYAGGSASFTFTEAIGSSNTARQWFKDGVEIPGATSYTYSIYPVQTTDAGRYTVLLTNGTFGSTLSQAAVLTVQTLPGASLITRQPADQAVPAGSTLTLTVEGTANMFQWYRDGVRIPGATGATYTVGQIQPSQAGNYMVVVSDATYARSSNVARITVTAALPSRLINLSILTAVTADAPSFKIGTVLGGRGTSGTKAVVIRAVGPSLAPLGVANVLADPRLEVVAGGGSTVVATNDNWGGGSALATAMVQVGAFALLSATSRDAVAAPSLAAGDYVVEVRGNASGTGTVIAELYDATPTVSYTAATPRLINVSVLKDLGSGLTAGFVIGGGAAKTLLLRAIGPGLAAFGVAGTVADPQLELFDGASKSIGTNDNWDAGLALSAAFSAVGAFDLNRTSKDAALLMTLQPGNYSVQVSGIGGTGTALVEIYEVP